MRKRTRRPKDLNQLAKQIVDESTDDSKIAQPSSDDISKFMRMMGSKGGKIGGIRRAQGMTPKERSASARKAAKARWNKPS